MEIFKKNIALEIIVSAMVAVTVCLFGPLEILLSQSLEFWFSVTDVLPIIIVSSLLVFAALLLIFLIASKINEKVLKIVISVIAALGFCAYIQGNWTFVNYGTMDGTPVDWSNYTTWSVINTGIWSVLAIAVIYLINSKKNLEFICKYLFAGVIGIEIITLGTLVIGTAGKGSAENFSLEGVGEFELSADKNNVIVLVADGFDGTDFLPVLDAEPSFKECFDGFTFYKDTCGTSLYSEESIITILTGNQFEVGASFEENIRAAYKNSDLYDTLKSNDYETYLYCEEKVVSPDILDNIKNFSESRSNIGSIKEASGGIYKMVAFRYMPHLLKKYFWYSTMEFSDFKGGESRLYYNFDVYTYLEQHGVQTSSDKNVYQFFWIQGPHEPANTDRYCRRIENTIQMDNPQYSESQFEQTIGVVRLFTKLIESLKDAGVYDNTTVIFTADHGWDIRPNPLLLIKPANSRGELAVSNAPVSMIEDYLPTLKYFLTGEDNGNTIYSLEENQIRDRMIYQYYVDSSNERIYENKEIVIYPQGAFDEDMKLGRKLSPDQIRFITEYGFSSSEIAHIWTDGYEASMKLDIKEKFHNIKWDINYTTFNGVQPVEVYVNDALVAEFNANGVETRSIIIPGDLITDNTMDIKLMLPKAEAPCNVDPNASDSRKLAICFLDMTFSDTDEEIPEGQFFEKPYYELGTEIYFCGEKYSADKYCGYGFSYMGTDGTWTDQKTAEMKFLLTDHTGNDLELKMNYVTFNGPQNVTVYANGEKIESYIADGMETKSITIPASCIKDDALQLTFELPGAVSPKELGQSEDARTLALYFESMSIS